MEYDTRSKATNSASQHVERCPGRVWTRRGLAARFTPPALILSDSSSKQSQNQPTQILKRKSDYFPSRAQSAFAEWNLFGKESTREGL